MEEEKAGEEREDLYFILPNHSPVKEPLTSPKEASVRKGCVEMSDPAIPDHYHD